MTQAEVRTLLAKFGLKADQVTSRVGRLSPGERTRAAMALPQARGVNLLVLDEPTNHLDLPAIQQLEQALASYDGALLLVSHDRRLLENVRLDQRWERSTAARSCCWTCLSPRAPAGYVRSMAKHWIATRPGDTSVFSFEDHDVEAPDAGEVTIEVRAAGMNPADAKHVARGNADDFPRPIGYEVSGVVTAIGPDTEIGSGPVSVGDEVLAFRISGGWATDVTVAARDVFAEPSALSFGEAANLLLAGCTAAEMLHVTGVGAGDTILVHGASGAVGVSVLQQAAMLGARAVGTASRGGFASVSRFGGLPVAYGDGLEQRVREVAPDGVGAALDCVGTDEAVDVSLALVADRDRIVTIAAAERARVDGFTAIGGAMPASEAYRDSVRARLVQLAGEGRLVVPVARTFALADAVEATELLMGGHPGGKLVLEPSKAGGPTGPVLPVPLSVATARWSSAP